MDTGKNMGTLTNSLLLHSKEIFLIVERQQQMNCFFSCFNVPTNSDMPLKFQGLYNINHLQIIRIL